MSFAESIERCLGFLVEKAGKGKLCPVIGAGAGVDRGGPDWRQLIEDLCAEASWQKGGSTGDTELSHGWLERLENVVRDAAGGGAGAGNEEFEAGRLLEELQAAISRSHGLEGGARIPREADPMHYYDLLRFDRNLAERLYHVLYDRRGIESRQARYRERSSASWPAGRQPEALPESANNLLATLTSIVALVAPKRRFHAINYNLDIHFEEEIRRLGHYPVISVVDQNLGPIQLSWKEDVDNPRDLRVGQHGRRVKVRVFHPHGVIFKKADDLEIFKVEKASRFRPSERRTRLPERKDEGRRGKSEFSHFGMVLGRFDYNELFGSLNDPRNLEQLAAFSRLNCLFYGMSFKDPNVDRLLEVASRLLNSSLEQPDPEEDTPALRHVALRRAEGETQLTRPRAAGWTIEDEVDFREQQRIAGQWVYRIGHAGFEQHRRFVIELIRRLARDLEYYWPGSWSPHLRGL